MNARSVELSERKDGPQRSDPTSTDYQRSVGTTCLSDAEVPGEMLRIRGLHVSSATHPWCDGAQGLDAVLGKWESVCSLR